METDKQPTWEIRRYIVRKGVRVEITGCFWCGNSEHVCSSCVSKADKAVEAKGTKNV